MASLSSPYKQYAIVAGNYWAFTLTIALAMVWLASLFLLRQDLGKAKNKPKFHELFSNSKAVNILSAARLFLFGARDVWFVVALPVFI